MRTDIILGAIMLAMAVAGGVVSAHAPTKLWQKVVYGCAFLVLAVVGMYFVIRQSNETAVASANLAQSIESLSASSRETVRVQHLNAQLQEQLLDQTKTIGTLAKTGIQTTTGGNSICYLQFNIRNKDEVNLVVLQIGRYPLSDVVMRMLDNDNAGISVLDVSGIYIGTLPVGGYLSPPVIPNGKIWKLPDKQEKRWTIEFSARNGTWDQFVLLRRTDDKIWHFATRVLRNSGQITSSKLKTLQPEMQKPVFETADNGFPKLKAGDWSTFNGQAAYCINCRVK